MNFFFILFLLPNVLLWVSGVEAEQVQQDQRAVPHCQRDIHLQSWPQETFQPNCLFEILSRHLFIGFIFRWGCHRDLGFSVFFSLSKELFWLWTLLPLSYVRSRDLVSPNGQPVHNQNKQSLHLYTLSHSPTQGRNWGGGRRLLHFKLWLRTWL